MSWRLDFRTHLDVVCDNTRRKVVCEEVQALLEWNFRLWES